jgi:acyl dehydratase
MSTTISQGRPGDKFKTGSKFISEDEEIKFCEITLNLLPIFLSDAAAQKKGWKKRLVPGALTLSCSIGLMEQAGLLDDVIAFMALDKLRYLAPVYIGDTIYVEVEFIEKKGVKEGTRDLINYKFTTYNQHDKPVLEAVNT